MFSLDTTATEHILECLEAGGHLFPQCKFLKLNNRLQLLGKGGFSSVYEMIAEENPKKQYAIKVIGFEKYTVTHEEFWLTTGLQRNLSEQSSNIVRIIDRLVLRIFLDEEGNVQDVKNEAEAIDDEEGILLQFILMEKQEHILTKDKFGNTIMARTELLEEKEVLEFACQVGHAIFVAHNNKILHRDIKLENIFWNEKEQQYELGDFGIAKNIEDGIAETILYTDGYGAPEIQCKIENHYTSTADIYSFGISLYVLLNDLKFPGSGGYYMNLVQYSPEFIFPAPRNASGELTRIIRKMCSYYPEERYQSMIEVLTDLNRLKMDDSDSEDFDELEELTTETYREPERELLYIQDRNMAQFGCAQRKELLKEKEKSYNRLSGRFVIVFSIFLIMMMKGLKLDAEIFWGGKFWIFPLMVLVEAVLQRLKEFHIIFGTITILFLGFSMFQTGITVPHIVLIASVLIGVPVITFASATGIGLWMWLDIQESFSWLDFAEVYDLGWLALICVLYSLNRLIVAKLEIGIEKKIIIWMWIYDKLSFVMIITGIVLIVLQHLNIMVIPEVVRRIHLIRSGIILFFVYMIEDADYDEMEEGVVEENVHVDK